MKLLIVDDEAPIRDALAYNFRREGFDVITAEDAGECLVKTRERKPNLIILDVMLPSGSGFDLCRIIRSESAIPIILLSARADEFDRVHGLNLGADDYVVKPFSMRELTARTRSLLRRVEDRDALAPETLEADGIQIDAAGQRVSRDGEEVALPPRAISLLYFLASHPGQVFTRDTLLDRVWGSDACVTERTVDVHVRWIRERIEYTPSSPRLLLTVRGIGYKFNAARNRPR